MNFKFIKLLFLLFSLSILGQQVKHPNIDKHLLNLSSQNKLSTKDIIEYVITDKVTSKNNVTHYYFRQSYQGIEIIGTESSLHLFNNKVVSHSNNFVSNKEYILKREEALHKKAPESVINSLAKKLNYTQFKGVSKKSFPQKSYNSYSDKNTFLYSKGGISKNDIPLKKIYYLTEDNIIVSGWELSINELGAEGNWYNYIVKDSSGEILSKVNWKSECNDFNHQHNLNKVKGFDMKSTKRKASEDGNNTYSVFPYPIENPHFGTQSKVSLPHNEEASPFGWHDVDGIIGAEYTVTRGNNVNAYEDGDNRGHQPDGGTELVFDFPFNPSYSSSDQSEDAAITNLFYWNNIIHDILYHYGFDEESGNFQVKNYTGNGIENDEVLAEAQDNLSSCNAFFSSPPDGINGVMQMFICSDRDGSFDNHVVIHEYIHGLSNRLTGGPSNADCLRNAEQMGEGWSDWYGNMLTMTKDDVATDLRGVGTWLFGGDINGRGVRDYPYTTDLSEDPRTYNSIKTSFSPHQTGSVWAAMLWDLTWNLIAEYGFDEDIYNGSGGNNIALALVTEALKIQPCSPGFVDGRDAILAADQILNSGVNQCLIWDSFAKRGLGVNADQGSSNSVTDGIESFESFGVSFTLAENSFCELLEPVILSGGFPLGGTYSGKGVTDNGDGETFTFNPSLAGAGTHTITYVIEEVSCGINSTTATIEVTDKTPKFDVQNITIQLTEENIVSIEPKDVVLGFSSTDEYIVDTEGIFNPEDITDKQNVLSLSDDSLAREIPIGFDFIFFGEQYSKLNISSNGFINFGEISSAGCCSGQVLPSSFSPNNLIALAWTDLFPNSSNNVSYAMVGEAPNRIFIINYNGIASGGGGSVTSQLKLFEKESIIEIHSTDVSGSSMTQGIENKLGDTAYVVDGRNRTTLSLRNDFVSFIPEKGNLPNECGLENTVTLDKNTFDCSDFGENTVIATVTDSEGNSSSKEIIVTILPFSDIEFTLSENEFCKNDEIITGLMGGFPEGGVYSGEGVTDDGNGRTFSLDIASLEVGKYAITYTQNNSCDSSSQINAEIEITPIIPDIETVSISTSLDETGSTTISLEDIIVNNNTSSIYAISNTSGINIAKYFYDEDTNDISVDSEFPFSSTSTDYSYAIDYNLVTKKIYLLASSSTKSLRNLYEIDLENENSLTFIDNVISVNSDTRPQDMAFDNEGRLYFTFKNGEINTYDIESKTMSSFTNISGSGSEGLTYDFDNNRLIHTTSNRLSSIDIASKEVTSLFNISFSCRSQAIEYVGNNKLIASSVSGCNTIYTIDLETQEIEILQNPSGSFVNIKDLLFIENTYTDNCNNEALNFSIDKETFTCDDIGDNTINISASDNSGNTRVFQTNIEILDFNSINFEMSNTIFCTDEGILSDLGGGYPEGGVYTGTGIIDSGNGINFSIDTSLLEPGIHSISYQFSTSCNTLLEKDIEIEILSAIPEISCQDITVELDDSGNAVITPEQLLGINNNESFLYTLSLISGTKSITRYLYNAKNDEIIFDKDFNIPTNFEYNHAFDYNPTNGKTYILSFQSNKTYLNEIDLDSGEIVQLDEIKSLINSSGALDMVFDKNGILYFSFFNGEINSYNIETKELSSLTNLSISNNALIGMTYNGDRDKLIIDINNSLSEINTSTGNITPLFSLENPICSGSLAIEYVGNNTLIATNHSCNKVYTIDLKNKLTNVLIDNETNTLNVVDFMFAGQALEDNCSNEPLNFSLSKDTFTCEDLGENTVTLTASNSRGSSASCSATVTVIEQNNISFDMSNTTFCIDEDIITDLTGGFPTGGVYSGDGVVDDGNGTTFSFNPSLSSVGTHNLFYEYTNTCGTISKTQIEVEIQPAIPEIRCIDEVSLELSTDGTLNITAQQLLFENTSDGILLATTHSSSLGGIAKYEYNTGTDEIIVDSDFSLSTGLQRKMALDLNPITKKSYLLASDNQEVRNLYEINIESQEELVFIDQIVSVNGDNRVQDMSFDNNGNLYFIFKNGEVNKYDVNSKTISSFSNIIGTGNEGLTYDFDNNRLIHSSSNVLSAIDVVSGEVSSLFSFSFSCNSQAIEYVGNNKLIVSSTQGCNTIYTINLENEEIKTLLSPSGTFGFIKDLLFISNTITDNCNNQPLSYSLSQSTFDCNDIGENTVTVTAFDERGNTSTCTTTINIIDNTNIELNLSETTFCKSASIFTELGGGIPIGGVYSGDGVTDSGNGSTFSLNTSLLEIGNSTVYYEYTNDCGTSLRTEVTVEVIPALPDISYQNIIAELDDNGNTIITPEDLLFEDNTIVDNCDNEPLNFSLDKNSFNCSNIGDNTVLITVSDNNGNSSTSEVIVSVIDNTPPTINTVDKLVLDLNIEESRTITLDDIFLNGDDNCSEEITYSISKTTFSCEDVETVFLEDINIISNGSFEESSENWTINSDSTSSSSSCNVPWKIDSSSSDICCCVDNIDPTDGLNAIFTSFDSSTAETNYTLSQIIKIPDNLNGKAELSFDWLGNFSLTFGSGTLDRVFTVSLYDENDSLIDVVYSYNIPVNETSSINNSVNLDILDTLLPYTGEDIRLEFNAFIPEASTGPGKSLLDNIKLLTQTSSNTFIVTTTATDSSGNVGESNTIIEISEDSCEVLSSSSYEEIQNSIILSPNPANKFVNFSIQNNSFDFVEIYNSNGSLIKKVSIQNRIGKIATKELSTGVYFLKFRRNNMTIVKKFIKIGQD